MRIALSIHFRSALLAGSSAKERSLLERSGVEVLHVSSVDLGDAEGRCLSQAVSEATLAKPISSVDLSGSQLAEAPAAVVQLQGLEWLDVSRSRVCVPPYGLASLRALRTLLARGNPLRGAQQTQAESGSPDALLGHLRDVQRGGRQPQEAIQVLLLGDQDAGKTSVATCLQLKRGLAV